MNEQRRKQLAKAANQVRKGIIEEVYSAQSGHPGGSLSIADVMRTGTAWCSPRAMSVPLYLPLWRRRASSPGMS